MAVALTVLGAALVVAGLDDMFRTLLRPTGRGSLSRLVFRSGWRMARRTGHAVVTGPTAMAVVVAVWVVLQTLGWALIYLPHLPEGFLIAPGINPETHNDAAEALYASLVTLTTLGFGDVVPVDTWVRLVSPLEAVAGFTVLTGALSWFTQVYPTLARRRALALELSCLAQAGYAGKLESFDPAPVTTTLNAVTAGIARVCVDLTENSETYYFRDPDPMTSLACQLPYAHLLARQAAASPAPEIRAAAETLEGALNAFSATLQDEFNARGDTCQQVLEIYAAEHGTASRS